MRYIGGKERIAKYIVPILLALREDNQIFLEPFVGAGSVFSRMPNPKIGSDLHPDLILCLRAVRDGWIPPKHVSIEEYKRLQKEVEPSHLRGFVGFACSYAGKWFGGYARDKDSMGLDRNFAKQGSNTLVKKSKGFVGAELVHCSYEFHNPTNMLIYCDPPYDSVTSIKIYIGTPLFNHALFWRKMREWSKDNTVIISSYKAPEDFISIEDIITKTDIGMDLGFGKMFRTERLFVYKERYYRVMDKLLKRKD